MEDDITKQGESLPIQFRSLCLDKRNIASISLIGQSTSVGGFSCPIRCVSPLKPPSPSPSFT